MKKMLLAINVLLLAVIIFQACKEKSSPGDPGKDNDPVDPSGGKCEIKCDYSDVGWRGSIPVLAAEELFNTYQADMGKNTLWSDGVNRTSIEDAESVWFPLETIKKYIWMIETNKCNNDCPDSLGIRIYYAKYPDSTTAFWTRYDADMANAGYHTVFMVPTYYDQKTEAHVDFNPFVRECGKGRLDTSSSVMSPILADLQNHGSLIPPKPKVGVYFR